METIQNIFNNIVKWYLYICSQLFNIYCPMFSISLLLVETLQYLFVCFKEEKNSKKCILKELI